MAPTIGVARAPLTSKLPTLYFSGHFRAAQTDIGLCVVAYAQKEYIKPLALSLFIA